MLTENTTTEINDVGGVFLEPPAIFLKIEASVLICIASIAIPGNILIIILQGKNKDKTSTDYLIMNMAMFELTYSSVLLPIRVLLDLPDVWKVVSSDSLCKFEYSLHYIMSLGSSWLLGVIAVDRYIKTCKPLNTNYTTVTARKIGAVISVAALIMGIPSTSAYVLGKDMTCIILPEFVQLMVGWEILAIVTLVFEFCTFGFTYTNIWLVLRRRHKKRVLGNLKSSHLSENVLSCQSRSFIRKISTAIVSPQEPTTVKTMSSHQKRKDTFCINAPSFVTEHPGVHSMEGYVAQPSNISPRLSSNVARKLAASERNLNKTTFIMFILTVSFTIIWTLVAAAILTRRHGTVLGIVVDRLSYVLPMLNCTTNPTFFFLMSSKFRKDAKKLFRI